MQRERCEKCIIESNWISLNILFPPGTTKAQRDATIRQIETEIRNEITAYNLNFNFHLEDKFRVDTCKCDSLLVNIDSKVTHPVGESVASTSSASSRASGNGWAVVSKNQPFQVDRFVDSAKRPDLSPSGTETIPRKSVDSNNIMAILDSGIDPSLFSPNISDILWRATPGLSIKNFVTARDKFGNFIYNSDNNNDDHFSKHGSVVTSLALKALVSSTSYPKIMVLKVMNGSGQGSTFDLSCALSYANQQGVNLVNLSLGYSGDPDSILHHYTGLTHRNRGSAVPVVAAAGNTETTHDPIQICNNYKNTGNEIESAWQFFPACFDLPNIISVTGLANESMPCFYQYYSKKFIKLGVVNTSAPCCGFNIGFYPGQIREGTSFVAPVVSGKIMHNIMTRGMHMHGRQYLTDLAPANPAANNYTINRALITY